MTNKWLEYLTKYCEDNHINMPEDSILRDVNVVIEGDKVIIPVIYKYHYDRLITNKQYVEQLINDYPEAEGKSIEIYLDTERTYYPEILEREKREAEESRVRQIEERKEAELRRIERTLENTGIIGLDNYSFDTIEQLPGNKAALKLAKGWCEDNISGSLDYHHFITLVGESGRGKTKIALTAFVTMVKSGDDAIFYLVTDLLEDLKSGFNNGRYEQIEQKCRDIDLLVLDDLGMQKNTEWVIEQLDSLIDYRYRKHKATIFTTNLRLDELQPRIGSRLSEGEIAILSGEDYRKILALRRKQARQN